MPENHKSWILENGLVLSKEKFQKSLTEARVAGLGCKVCKGINSGLHSAEFGGYNMDARNLHEGY